MRDRVRAAGARGLLVGLSGGVDLLPVGALVKRDVRLLARELGVPSEVVDRTPTAGLWADQSDEADFELTYAELERYLEDGPEAVAPALAMKIERLTRASEHKRQLPPIAEIE